MAEKIPSANIIFDNAHSDGVLTKLGFGREWKAGPPNIGDDWKADFTEYGGWNYSESVRFIEALECLTLKPTLNSYNPLYFYSGYFRTDNLTNLGAADIFEMKTHLTTEEENATTKYKWRSYTALGTPFFTSRYVTVNSGKWALSPQARKYRNKKRFMLIGKTEGDEEPYRSFKHYGSFTTNAYLKNIGLDIYAGPMVEGDLVNETSVNPDGGGLFIEFLATDDNDDNVDTHGPDYTDLALYLPRIEEDSVTSDDELFFNQINNTYYETKFETATLLIKTPYDTHYKALASLPEIDIFNGSMDSIEVTLYIEWIDNHLVITVFDENGNETNTVTYAPSDFRFKNTMNFDVVWKELKNRRVKVSAAGSVFKIGIGNLSYENDGYLYPATYTQVPSSIEYTPNYYVTLDKTSFAPALEWTDVTGATDTRLQADYYRTDLENNDNEVTGGNRNYDKSRPRLTMDGVIYDTGAHDGYLTRKVRCFYSISEYREPTIASGTSTEIETQNNTNMRLQRVSGTMDDSWQNHSVDFEIESFTDTLPEINPNLKTTIQISLDNGSTYTNHFVGYLSDDYDKNIETVADGNVIFSLNAKDPINSRLDKKVIYFQCAFDGWSIDKAFKYILNCAGVPDSRIHIAPSIETYIENNSGFHKYIIPMNDKRGTKDFLYSPETKVRQVLNELVEAVDLRWGTDIDGKYKLLKELEYTHGTSEIAFTADRDTLTDEDIVFSFERSRNYEDFANVYIIIGGRGWESNSRMYIDIDSISDYTADNFIGDNWINFEWVNSERTIVKNLRKNVTETRENVHRIYLELHNHETLMPDDYIKVQVEDVNIDTDSIYRIVNKNWTVDVDQNYYTQELEAVLVYTP